MNYKHTYQKKDIIILTVTNLYDSIKDQVKVSDVIGQYLTLSKKSNSFICVCPFHNDTKPSLSINDVKKVFKCFACNTAGDAIKFVALKENISYQQAAAKIISDHHLDPSLLKVIKNQSPQQKLADDVGFMNQKIAFYFHMWLNDLKNKSIKQYLKKRKISDEMIELFQIGYAPKDNFLTSVLEKVMDSISAENEFFTWKNLVDYSLIKVNEQGKHQDYFFNRIIFPIANLHNQIIGFSGRAMEEQKTSKYMNSKESAIFLKKNTLYNLNLVNKNLQESESLYICEGFFDVISAYQAGIHNIVGTMGVALTNEHTKLLKQLNIKKLILAFDNDQAGMEVTLKYLQSPIAQQFDLFVIDHQNNPYKDFNEFLVNQNEEKLKDQLQKYVHYSVFLLQYFVKLYINENDLIAKNNYHQKIQQVIAQTGQEIYISNYVPIYMQINDRFTNDIAIYEIRKILRKQNLQYQKQVVQEQSKTLYKLNYQFRNQKQVANTNNLYSMFAAMIQSQDCYQQVCVALNPTKRFQLLPEYSALLDYFDTLYIDVNDKPNRDNQDYKLGWFINKWDPEEHDHPTNDLYSKIKNFILDPKNHWPWINKENPNEKHIAITEFANWAIRDTIPFLKHKKNLPDR
ncbi:DNA primase [Ureaplasma sp. ES3154-GEN]|uniref:DNA primase n=1 Tax=Ureaplasma sp. ES3154-GEN TaxID=2984844 RepID=UPI0021E86841|nr:DNA primase [Ureaplasma sp. ES3154-GEN]MCV3743686.1 DNA primase [Ureaplasma sp. ES3154-GEN]